LKFLKKNIKRDCILIVFMGRKIRLEIDKDASDAFPLGRYRVGYDMERSSFALTTNDATCVQVFTRYAAVELDGHYLFFCGDYDPRKKISGSFKPIGVADVHDEEGAREKLHEVARREGRCLAERINGEFVDCTVGQKKIPA
jgi:hypothetical protein